MFPYHTRDMTHEFVLCDPDPYRAVSPHLDPTIAEEDVIDRVSRRKEFQVASILPDHKGDPWEILRRDRQGLAVHIPMEDRWRIHVLDGFPLRLHRPVRVATYHISGKLRDDGGVALDL